MSSPIRSVLVTGATGFLGGAVARDLVARGIEVMGVGRNPIAGETLSADGVIYTRCDLATDRVLLERLVADCDVVVHCAALSAPWGRKAAFEAANVTATANVIAACVRSSVRKLVHISSPSVIASPVNQRGLAESTPWTMPPANHYAATKRKAETLVLEAAGRGLDAIVLRPKALFGPGDTALLPRVLRVAERGTFPVLGTDDPLMDLTWIGDAVEAVRLAIEAPAAYRGRVYHVTSGDPQPRSRVFKTMFDSCGLLVRYRPVALNRALAVARVLETGSRIFTLGRWEPPFTRYSVMVLGVGQTLDISAARTDLGYRPTTDVLERLRETGRRWRAARDLINEAGK